MATQVNSVGDSDRISGLPDPILSHILSLLPTKEAIRTSVLSPRWRYQFASMSTFDFGRDCLQSLASRNGNNFKNFVDRLLHFPNPVSLECYTFSHMKSLKKSHITIYDNDERDPTNLLQAICNVQSLYMKVDLPPTFYQASREPSVAFNNLVELHLVCALGEELVEFLHLVPNLKILTLAQTFADEFRHGKVPSCLSFHLKEITFSGFIGDDYVFEIYSYFLKHALILEKLRITINKHHPEDEYNDLKKILRSLKISIHKLYLKDKPRIIKKVSRLPWGRDVEVSVELKEDEM